MGIGKRIKEARERKGLTQEELGKLIGVTGSAITNYEKETSHPKEPVMYALIDALGVDANFLFQDCIKIKDSPLSPKEMEHIKKYRALDEHGKEIVDTNLEIEHKRCMAAEAEKQRQAEEAAKRQAALAGGNDGEQDNIKYMDVYLNPAAAGVPLPAEGDREQIPFPRSQIPYNADCGVRISGDSMEPDIPDHSLVWVEQKSRIESRQVGIFSVDGEFVCKRFFQDGPRTIRLESDNPDYGPVELHEWSDVRLFGVVVGVWPPQE